MSQIRTTMMCPDCFTSTCMVYIPQRWAEHRHYAEMRIKILNRLTSQSPVVHLDSPQNLFFEIMTTLHHEKLMDDRIQKRINADLLAKSESASDDNPRKPRKSRTKE